jgi:hypothetical protein
MGEADAHGTYFNAAADLGIARSADAQGKKCGKGNDS